MTPLLNCVDGLSILSIKCMTIKNLENINIQYYNTRLFLQKLNEHFEVCALETNSHALYI